jgi:HD-like signal output (HDOD) protein
MAGDGDTQTALVDELIEELERLPSQPTIGMQVLFMTDDPTASAQDLARVIAADPSLTARILKVANSAYYGLSGRVMNVGFAVTVIGFATVRSMAAATASGLYTQGERVAPPGFWEHGLAVASAASKLADRVDLRRADAFSLGLLHDLGAALLFRSDPVRYDDVLRRSREEHVPLSDVEREAFGLSHDEAAGRVLAAWQFPEDFVATLRAHHEPLDASSPGALRVLAAAEAVAGLLPMAPVWEMPDAFAGLAALDLSMADAGVLAEAVQQEAAELLAAFS